MNTIIGVIFCALVGLIIGTTFSFIISFEFGVCAGVLMFLFSLDLVFFGTGDKDES